LEFNPHYMQSRSKRAVVRCKLGDFAAAVSDYTHILVDAPNAARTYYERGNADVQLGNYPQALADLARAIELSSEASREYERLHYMNRLAQLLATCPQAQCRDGNRAVEMAQEIVAVAEGRFDRTSGVATLARFKKTLAAGYAEAGRYPEAVSEARQALQLLEEAGADPNEIDTLRHRLSTYETERAPASVD
jgi:tetratricopeptide (TPR) repeat protein